MVQEISRQFIFVKAKIFKNKLNLDNSQHSSGILCIIYSLSPSILLFCTDNPRHTQSIGRVQSTFPSVYSGVSLMCLGIFSLTFIIKPLFLIISWSIHARSLFTLPSHRQLLAITLLQVYNVGRATIAERNTNESYRGKEYCQDSCYSQGLHLKRGCNH